MEARSFFYLCVRVYILCIRFHLMLNLVFSGCFSRSFVVLCEQMLVCFVLYTWMESVVVLRLEFDFEWNMNYHLKLYELNQNSTNDYYFVLNVRPSPQLSEWIYWKIYSKIRFGRRNSDFFKVIFVLFETIFRFIHFVWVFFAFFHFFFNFNKKLVEIVSKFFMKILY